jgi:acyl-CoA synthetase (AMP-forming)/AMP-acid ligase II/alkylation response protein AidB-like acyl-CoA dehydrogenase/acyl carrier protein
MNNQFKDLVELLLTRAKEQPSRIAYTFLLDGEDESQSIQISYQELDRQARAIAIHLQSIMNAGDVYDGQSPRALMLYPAGLDFITAFFGCLYAGIVPIPAYPPRQNHKLSRLEAIVLDAEAKIVLTTSGVMANLKDVGKYSSALAEIEWLPTNDLILGDGSSWVRPEINGETLAFLQYTSGSTGTPKGVMVTHDNLLRNSADLDLGWDHDENSVIVTWLPTFHDMGLIYGMLQPLYKGCTCYMMAPVSFLQKPIRWLQAISRYRGTHSGAPNFAYKLCAEKITPEQRAKLDLSSWRMALNGAEPVRADVLEEFVEAFKPSGFDGRAFCPGYGLAEATLKVSAVRSQDLPVYLHVDAEALEQHRVVEVSANHPRCRQFVGCGWTEIDTQIVIVNPETLTQRGDDEVGEIWASGSTIPLGYWNRPEATAETFQAYLKDTKAGPYLRTGDLGFVHNGELFVTGRIKDVIIIRGRNHYPQDIELTVEKSHPALRPTCTAAFTVEIEGEERLIVAQEIERLHLRKLDVEEVVGAIRKAVSQQHELQLYAVILLKTATIPKTSSGKIQRRTCRAKFVENALEVVGEWKFETEAESEVPVQSVVSKTKADNIIEWLRGYAGDRINSRLIDERRCIPPYIVLDFGNRGLLGMQIPEEYGGLALNYRDTFRVFEQLAAIDLTLASFVAVHHVLGTRPILNYAPENVRREILPLLAGGRELAGFAITEQTAGSNPRAIATRAIPDAGGWRIRGEKIWIGHGSWAGVTNVFAQTLDANNQPTGISSFIIRQGTPGFSQGPEALTMGVRGMVQNTIYLKDVLVTPENLLGTLNNGMEVAQDAMMHGRLIIGVMSLGGMKRCAQLMLRYSSRRSVSTGRLLNNPISLVWLSDLTAAITSLETLLFKIADLLDQGRAIPQEAFTVCKTAGPELVWQAADRLVQMLGGRGYIETNIAPQILRDARLFRIFEGPTETLNMFLGSRAMNQGAELHRFLSEELGAPTVAENLVVAVNQIKTHLTSVQPAFLESKSAQHWAYIRTGEVVTFAILLAAVQGELKRSPSAELQRAVTWAKLQFEQKLASVLTGTPAEKILSDAEAVSAQISDYIAAIGDVVQTSAGENHNLDELLQLEAVGEVAEDEGAGEELLTDAINLVPYTDAMNRVSTPNSCTDAIHRVSIQNWLEKWLIKKLRIAARSVNANTSFADYGLDSVMAVELAQDLEEWLKYPLESTILWNFPTVKSLAEHLASLATTPEPQDSVKVSAKAVFEFIPPTATAVETSIAQELAKLENLLGKNGRR